MDPKIVYFACVVGAVGLFLALRPGHRAMRAAGGVLALGALAWLLVAGSNWLAQGLGSDQTVRPQPFFVIFGLIALASAGRMITHHRPVYSALYFVMVVLSSAGLFLLLEAEFMAFALIIVYAGAILITYLFVLMLAQQAPQADDPQAQPEYDVNPREPAAAAVVGFIMLALFTSMIFQGAPELPPAPSSDQTRALEWAQLQKMPKEFDAAIQRVAPGARQSSGAQPVVVDGKAYIDVIRPGESLITPVELMPESLPNNVQMVGLDLVAKFPVSLELAGVILLMAMFGAVVLARKQIELGEDEVREAAGMRALALHSEEPHEPKPAPPAGRRSGGAT